VCGLAKPRRDSSTKCVGGRDFTGRCYSIKLRSTRFD
jgi:hypothetical protein